MTGACDKLADSSAAVAAWGMTLSCSSSLHNTTAARHTFVTHQIVLPAGLAFQGACPSVFGATRWQVIHLTQGTDWAIMASAALSHHV